MLYLALFCFVVCFALLWLFLFRKFHLLDKPWSDLKGTRKPVPTMQWIFVYLIFLLAVLFFFHDDFSNSLVQSFLIWGGIIVVVELVTELEYIGKITFKIPPFVRFLFHFFASFLTLYLSGITDFSVSGVWFDFVIPQWIFYFLFSLRSVFIINAVNRIDGVNAQGNGILTIGFFTIYCLIHFIVFQSYTEFPNESVLHLVEKLSLLLGMISLVYTVIEFKPFGLIRDIWTMFLAFGLAYLSLLWGTKIGTIIVTLSLVIFDALWIIRYRIFILKKNPMKWDYTHLHHRLLWLWWTRWEVRAFVWIFSLFMMLLILLQGTDRLHKVIIFCVMAVLFFWINTYLFIYKKLPCGLNKEKEN